MAELIEKTQCYHCGDQCGDEHVIIDNKHFCCPGCKLVFEILEENNLCAYYDYNKSPGVKHEQLSENRFRYLDEKSIQHTLIKHRNKNQVSISFYIPDMHCSSCIWLLEKLNKLDAGILSSKAGFLKKEVWIVYDEDKTSLRKVVELLSATGYEPSLHLDATDDKSDIKTNRARILKIGIAGFCFGNIMMLSFPEYFSSGNFIEPAMQKFFSYLIFLLAIPVFFFSSSEFFINSFKAIKFKSTSIDIPIATGITAIFIRSAYEIISGTGQGFFDSGSGLVFFMLIGRWFQDFTFDSLSFDRSYKSYFPIAVTVIQNGVEKDIPVNDLKVKDRFLVRNNEIVPVDALLYKGIADINYQFVTGESTPNAIQPGETIFAGGKQCGGLIELQATKTISQGYIAELWNRKFEGKGTTSGFELLVREISKWFIVVTFMIAFIAAAYWWNTDIHKAVNAFTAVLVIACPCALALSAPFTYGNILRILGRNKIFFRDNEVIEKLADIDTVVFDKTGTLTRNNQSEITFFGNPLTGVEKKFIASLFRQSSHPLSRMLYAVFSNGHFSDTTDFKEESGYGISSTINDVKVKAGSENFVCGSNSSEDTRTKVYLSFNNIVRGYFVFSNSYRSGVAELAGALNDRNYELAILTGDNQSERDQLNTLFSGNANLIFNQTPKDKLEFIDSLHERGKSVMMVGDGLNDAGALLQSDVGISITEDTNSFTPASDGIIDASCLRKLPNLLAYSKSAVKIIITSFIISLLYNFVGLAFAVTGTLAPVIAAILMPISTISLVLFTVFSSSLKGRMLGFK